MQQLRHRRWGQQRLRQLRRRRWGQPALRCAMRGGAPLRAARIRRHRARWRGDVRWPRQRTAGGRRAQQGRLCMCVRCVYVCVECVSTCGGVAGGGLACKQQAAGSTSPNYYAKPPTYNLPLVADGIVAVAAAREGVGPPACDKCLLGGRHSAAAHSLEHLCVLRFV